MTVRKLNAHALAADISGGLDEAALMDKYALSASQLKAAVGKLLQTHLITESTVSRFNGCGNVTVEESHHLPSGVPRVAGEAHIEESGKKCPHCGMSRMKSETECSHCGIVFSKLEQPGSTMHPTHIAPGQIDPALQTGTYHDLVASTFYADVSEVQEQKRKKRLWIIWTAAVLAFIPFPLALFGYGKHITLIYTLGSLIFVFFYYLVVVYYAWQQSHGWGLLCFWFSPAAIAFVILNWNGIFSEKFLPKLWLAIMGPLTVVIFLEKYCHLNLFPQG